MSAIHSAIAVEERPGRRRPPGIRRLPPAGTGTAMGPPDARRPTGTARVAPCHDRGLAWPRNCSISVAVGSSMGRLPQRCMTRFQYEPYAGAARHCGGHDGQVLGEGRHDPPGCRRFQQVGGADAHPLKQQPGRVQFRARWCTHAAPPSVGAAGTAPSNRSSTARGYATRPPDAPAEQPVLQVTNPRRRGSFGDFVPLSRALAFYAIVHPYRRRSPRPPRLRHHVTSREGDPAAARNDPGRD
jgi:hypothetical protein